MSVLHTKTVRWQIPFVSRNGNKYRIDIYDEGTHTPVQLTGGTTPFVTNEDSSDDFFHPLRAQTGTIQVCTLMPNGNYITLDDLLPANNLARPVRLMDEYDPTGHRWRVAWQGFLSCEAYSQHYQSTPQILELPVISVLEAMDSAPSDVDLAAFSGLKTVESTITTILEAFIAEAGISYFDEFYVPGVACGRNILKKMINISALFEKKEYDNENSTTYIASCLPFKECLQRIAVYMGWVIREKSNALYFTDARERTSYLRYYRTNIQPGGHGIHLWNSDSIETVFHTQDMATLEWMGTDHRRSISAGAKSVEVVARLGRYEVNIGLPECPVGDIAQYSCVFRTVESSSGPFGPNITIASICNKDNGFTNICDFYCYEMTNTARVGSTTSVNNVFTCALLNPDADTFGLSYNGGRLNYWYNHYIGAFMAKVKVGDADYIDGLYIVGMREAFLLNPVSSTNHLFVIRGVGSVDLAFGNLIIKCNAVTVFSGDTGRVWYDDLPEKMCLQIGNSYWDGTDWVGTFATFPLSSNETTIPISTRLTGEVSIRLYGQDSRTIIPSDQIQGFASDLFVSELSLDYQYEQSDIYTDRSENHYFRLLGTNFRDEVSINTDFASMLNNLPGPTLIMNNETSPMTYLNYGSAFHADLRKPEVDLLNRLATYYNNVRQKIELKAAPPRFKLPMLKLNGINDNKSYMPLAETYDWKQEVCQLTCLEIPIWDTDM